VLLLSLLLHQVEAVDLGEALACSVEPMVAEEPVVVPVVPVVPAVVELAVVVAESVQTSCLVVERVDTADRLASMLMWRVARFLDSPELMLVSLLRVLYGLIE